MLCMNMKVFHVNTDGKTLERNSQQELSTHTHLIHEEKSFKDGRYFVYSVRVQSKQKSIGVESKVDNKIVGSLSERIAKENEMLRKLRFIVIDTKRKIIYFDGYRNDVYLIAKEFFDIDTEKMTTEVSLDDLVYLTNFTIVKKHEKTPGLFDKQTILSEDENIAKIFEGSSTVKISEEKYSIKLKDETRASSFFKDKYVIEKEFDNKEELFFEGLDQYGNKLIYDSILSKKIEILPEYETFDDKMKLELETVLNAIIEKVGE